MPTHALVPALESFVARRVLPELSRTKAARGDELAKLSKFIRSNAERRAPTHLVYICTHNSRRSHMAQLWAAVAAHYHGVSGVLTYSGGTEVTSFDSRAVASMRRAGFAIDAPKGENPRYTVHYADTAQALTCYSKRYDDPANPNADFAAVMTCSSADAACPVVLGSTLRVVTPYEDPKQADGTPEETARYDERCLEIAVDAFRVFELANQP